MGHFLTQNDDDVRYTTLPIIRMTVQLYRR